MMGIQVTLTLGLVLMIAGKVIAEGTVYHGWFSFFGIFFLCMALTEFIRATYINIVSKLRESK